MPADDQDDVIALLSRALMTSIRHFKEAGRTFEPDEAMFGFLTMALARSRRNYAQLAQDLWVLSELGDKRGGFFVEFGAGDGIGLSNTYLLESEYGWKGVLAEPNPVFHTALRRNRKAHISTKCVAARSGEAVTLLQTEDPLFSATEAYAFADWHAERRRSATPMQVETTSLVDLLRDAGAPKCIDYLSLDTEGGEYDILEAFDFSAYEVALLSVEHNHTFREADLDRLLGERGFRRRFAELTDFDAWYVNPSLERHREAPGSSLAARLLGLIGGRLPGTGPRGRRSERRY